MWSDHTKQKGSDEIMKTIKIGCCEWLALFLTVLFVILKLLGAIHWAWVWVASPAWIGFLFVAFCKGLTAFANSLKDTKKGE
jgi:energy-coupling factor transporter transmembrane protein EcfT